MAREYHISIVVSAKDKASQALGGIGSNIQSLGKVAIGLGGAAVAGVGALGVGLTKLAVDAAPLEGIEEAFYGIAEASGESGDKMLAALQKGSAGMITQRQLMEKYNLAAQLVGDQFANELPNAMNYLGKVSAATGEDMGFMMDSLVRGVGRLSPMILDNLGVQVNLTEAYEAHAAQIGKNVKDLTKQEQQTALMAQVMEKLAENTAAMPEVADSAAQGIASLGVRFRDLKDRVGLAVLPVLSEIIGVLTKVADVVLPLVVPAIEKLVNMLDPLIAGFSEIVDLIIWTIQQGGNLEMVLRNLLSLFLEWIGLDYEAQESIFAVINAVQDLVENVVNWVSQFVSWKDVLIALGVAIAAVVIPAIVSLAASVAPVIAVGVALIGLVALIRNAWESNFLGIRDVVAVVQQKVQELWAKAKEFWDGFWSAFEPALEAMHARLGQFYEEIQPALMQAWEALQNLWDTVVAMWREHLQPALNRLIEALGLGGEKTEEFGGKVGALAGLLLSVGLEALLNALVAAVEGFAAAVEAVASAMEWWHRKIKAVKDALSGLELPDWIAPGSPTPLELGIRGITDAMRELNAMTLGMPLTAGATSTTTSQYYFNMTVNTRATTSTVRQDFETMRAIVGAR